MPGVTMEVARKAQPNLGTSAGAFDLLLQEGQILLCRRVIDISVNPVGLWGAQYDPIGCRHLPGHSLKVLQLRPVYIRVQLHIYPQNPPTMGQTYCEVAST